MQLAEVIGTVVATEKSEGLDGVRFLILQPMDRSGDPSGDPVVAADALFTAGVGETVYFVSSREAAVALPEQFVPVDHAVVGIVDEVEIR
jgi:ethanolamine utilization protein EutN